MKFRLWPCLIIAKIQKNWKAHKYSRYFENDFQGIETKAKQGEYAGSLYFFEGDSLVEVMRELPEE